MKAAGDCMLDGWKGLVDRRESCCSKRAFSCDRAFTWPLIQLRVAVDCTQSPYTAYLPQSPSISNSSLLLLYTLHFYPTFLFIRCLPRPFTCRVIDLLSADRPELEYAQVRYPRRAWTFSRLTCPEWIPDSIMGCGKVKSSEKSVTADTSLHNKVRGRLLLFNWPIKCFLLLYPRLCLGSCLRHIHDSS